MLQVGQEWIEYQGRHWLDGYFKLKEQASAVTSLSPDDNFVHVYAKDSAGTSTLCFKNDADAETCLPVAGGTLVTGAGVANRLAFWTSVSNLDDVPRTLTAGSVLFAGTDFLPQEDNANFFWHDTDNRLGVKVGTTPESEIDVSSVVTATFSLITATQYNTAGGSGAGLQLRKSRSGTKGTFAAVQTDDPLGEVNVFGDDGVAFQRTAIMQTRAGENWSGTARGSYTRFFITPLTTTTLTEAMRITPSGGLTIGQTTDITAGVLNVLTGFRIAGAATSGNILRGDGTNFVSSAQSGIDHGSLGGLGDDDHTQYALLAGRSGGQILIGGTASGDDLTLKSTSNATKGSIFLGTLSAYDEVNDRLGIGNLVPTSKFWLRNDAGACQSDFEGNGNVGLNFWSFAASPLPFMQGIAARGTRASPTALGSGDLLFRFSTFGQFSTGASDFAEVATFAFNSSEAFTSTARGSRIQISTTKIGTTTNREVVRIDDQGFLGVQTTTPLSFLHAKDTTSSATVIQLLLQNEGAGSNTAAIGFQVASSGEYTTLGPKGGIAFERTAANGGGIFKFYNREDNDTAQYDANDLRMTLSNAGVLTLSSAAGFIDLTALTPKLFKVPTNNTDPTGGGGAATGRIPIHDAAGNLRYIAYY